MKKIRIFIIGIVLMLFLVGCTPKSYQSEAPDMDKIIIVKKDKKPKPVKPVEIPKPTNKQGGGP